MYKPWQIDLMYNKFELHYCSNFTIIKTIFRYPHIKFPT